MIERVISGGQTGADQAGLRAARACGIPTGGWAPRGWMTEAGPAPWLAEFGLAECPGGETEAERYRARRFRCVKDCDAALLFGDNTSPGSKGLNRDCASQGKPCVHIRAGLSRLSHVSEFLREAPYIKRMMIAGNRESRDPGIGERVERFVLVAFKSLANTPRVHT